MPFSPHIFCRPGEELISRRFLAEPGEVGARAGSQKGQRREEETGRQPDQSPHPELSARSAAP